MRIILTSTVVLVGLAAAAPAFAECAGHSLTVQAPTTTTTQTAQVPIPLPTQEEDKGS